MPAKKLKLSALVDVQGVRLSEIIEELTDFYEGLSEESRLDAYVEASYGDDYCDFYIYYSRMETEQEVLAREAREKDYAERKMKHDRELYEKLKAQFETKLEDML